MRLFGMMVAGVVLAGCSYTTNPLNSAPGQLTVTMPGSLPRVLGDDRIPPPPALMEPAGPVAPVGPVGLPPSGAYVGTGVALNDPGGRCLNHVRVTNFVVTGDRVRWGKLTGRIRPDGSLRMQAGPAFMTGQFTGAQFTGTSFEPQPACRYQITVQPVG